MKKVKTTTTKAEPKAEPKPKVIKKAQSVNKTTGEPAPEEWSLQVGEMAVFTKDEKEVIGKVETLEPLTVTSYSKKSDIQTTKEGVELEGYEARPCSRQEFLEKVG